MFNDPLSDRDLYWIGYFRADGCLVTRSYDVQAIFAQTHQAPVEAFRRYIGADNEVKFSERESNFGPNPMYKITSAKPGPALLALGVKTELRSDIYQQAAFWRGLLDGDGSVGIIYNRGYPYPSITWSGRLEDMQHCSEWVAKTLDRKAPKVGVARSIFRVGLVGTPAFNLIKLLYENQYSALPYKVEAAAKALEWKIKHEKMVRNA